MFQLWKNISLSYYAAVNTDISKLFLLFGTQRSSIVLKVTHLAKKEREIVQGKEPCFGQIVVRCAGFESVMLWNLEKFRGILASDISQQMLNL